MFFFSLLPAQREIYFRYDLLFFLFSDEKRMNFLLVMRKMVIRPAFFTRLINGSKVKKSFYLLKNSKTFFCIFHKIIEVFIIITDKQDVTKSS